MIRRIALLTLCIAGCAAPPAARPPGPRLPIGVRLRCHPSLAERQSAPILRQAVPVVGRFVEEVVEETADPMPEGDLPWTVAVIDTVPGRPPRWNLRLYTPAGELVFEDSAWGRGGSGEEGEHLLEALAEIGSNLVRSDRARSYALHRSVLPPEIRLRHREDAVYPAADRGE